MRRKQISQDGVARLSSPTASHSCLHFVNNDYIKAEIIHSTIHVHHEVYVTAEITYNTVHVHHEALAWSWVVCGTPV